MAKPDYDLINPATGTRSSLPVRSGTIGPDCLDVGAITKDQGVFTFDPAFSVTASCESKITYIDGDAGLLLYRGYPVEQLGASIYRRDTCGYHCYYHLEYSMEASYSGF